MTNNSATRTMRAFRLRTIKVALTAVQLLVLPFVARAAAGQSIDGPAPDLQNCPELNVSGGKVVFHAYAQGVQTYRWDGASWVFVAPQAVLFADAGGQGPVGIHYAGPTWESVSGSKVVGVVLRRCTPDANAIQWLLLGAVFNDGSGIFDRVTVIQRVNTVGGKAPAAPGVRAGDLANIPYTAEYFFYRTDS